MLRISFFNKKIGSHKNQVKRTVSQLNLRTFSHIYAHIHIFQEGVVDDETVVMNGLKHHRICNLELSSSVDEQLEKNGRQNSWLRS